jgi:uncharacterized protein YjbI with pentapeptide repeats
VTFSGQDMSKSNLTGSTIICSHLKDIDLTKSDLQRMNVLFCILESCNLDKCTLNESNFALSRFTRITMNESGLTQTSFMSAFMEDVQMKCSILDRVDLTLVNAEGLDITGAMQRGIIMERAKVKNLTR